MAQTSGESGKPAITAKKAFAVKHLHHKPRRLAGLDGRPETVDNCASPTAIAVVPGGS
jgi:hypothetical protein